VYVISQIIIIIYTICEISSCRQDGTAHMPLFRLLGQSPPKFLAPLSGETVRWM